MIKTDRCIYGTVKECVTEIVNMIDWDNMKFPNFDFCCAPYNLTYDNIISVDDPCDLGENWFGCKDASYVFEGEHEAFNLLFGYWGGGSNELVNFSVEEKNETEMIIEVICMAILDVTDYLVEDDFTLFDLIPETVDLYEEEN